MIKNSFQEKYPNPNGTICTSILTYKKNFFIFNLSAKKLLLNLDKNKKGKKLRDIRKRKITMKKVLFVFFSRLYFFLIYSLNKNNEFLNPSQSYSLFS